MEQNFSLADLAAFAKREKIPVRVALLKLLEQGLLPAQFKRNAHLLTIKEQIKLINMPIFVAGCGGLGGEIASHLARFGAGRLYLCDFDNFEESNLNRQRFCDMESVARKKAIVTAEALQKISPWGEFTPLIHKITSDSIPEEFATSFLVIDCLDSVGGKKTLEQLAEKNGLPWLYGSVLHNEGFACLQSQPGKILQSLYLDENQTGAGSVLSHVVAGTASVMISLFLKWLKNPEYSSPLIHMDFSVPELEKFSL